MNKYGGKKDENGAPKLIGILNINDMIPVNEKLINKIEDRKSVV